MALAIFAIANSRHQWFGIRPIANRAAQAAALNFLHDFLPLDGCIAVIIIPTDAIQTKPESAPAAWEEFYFPPALTVGGPADVGHRMMRRRLPRLAVIRPRSAAEPWGDSCAFVDTARTTRQIHKVARAPCQISRDLPKHTLCATASFCAAPTTPKFAANTREVRLGAGELGLIASGAALQGGKGESQAAS